MPRHSLGASSPSGASPVIRCKISHCEAVAAKAVVKKGESLSELMRLSLAREVRRRKSTSRKDLS